MEATVRYAHSLDDVVCDELGDLALRHDGVAEVEATVFPLYRAVDVDGVTQPVVRRSPAVTSYIVRL